MSIVAGIGWHVIGAAMAASFYAPIEKVKKWSWETTWAVAGFFSWILLPIGVSLFLLPDFRGFYASMGPHLLLKVALFGAMWGVGNVSYGLTMRHLGMSLGIGVAIGVTLIVGTLVPPLMHGQAAMLFATQERAADAGGRAGGADRRGYGFLCGASERSCSCRGKCREFNVTLGLLLAVMCGIFSSGMSFAIDAAKPHGGRGAAPGSEPALCGAAELRDHHGRRRGVNMSYCFIRLAALKRLSLRADLAQPRANAGEERAAGRDGRNHVVPAVLLLCMGRGEHSAAAVVCELDAAHEHLCAVRRAGGAGAGRVEGRGQQAGAAAVGGDVGDYCGGEPGGAGDGFVGRLCGKRQFGVEPCGNQVLAQAIDGGELDGLHAESRVRLRC